LLYHDTDLEGLLVPASVYLHYWLLITDYGCVLECICALAFWCVSHFML